MSEPSIPKTIRPLVPSRSSTVDSQTFRKQRSLQRATNLVTTKGHPVPAVAETILHVEAQVPSPPSTPSSPLMSRRTSHKRVHANSVPGSSSSYASSEATQGSARSTALLRRRSDGSASLGLGGSIKRKLQEVKDVSAMISRSRSRSKSSRGAPTVSGSDSVDPSSLVSRSISSQSPASGSSQSLPRVGGTHASSSSTKPTKRHGRSYSDILWKRPPRLSFSVSEPAVAYLSRQQRDNSMANAVSSVPNVASSTTVTSPDESPLQCAPSDRPLSTILEPAHTIDDGSHAHNLSLNEVPPTPDENPLSPFSPTGASAANEFAIPQLLLQGVPMLKVSAKKQKRYFFRLDADEGQIIWQSKKLRIIPIETIKEIRTGADARYYREQFQLSSSFEDRWLTLVYILDGSYKTLHLIAATRDVFQMWDATVRRLYEIRKQLMTGLGHGAMRQAVWEKQFWKGADEEKDQKLDFDDVERMCRRLNINPSRDDLLRRFKQADSQNRGFLDFSDFRKFVKALKSRPEVDRIFKRLVAASYSSDGYLHYDAFQAFMRNEQKSTLGDEELQRLFVKYASLPGGELALNTPASPARNALELAIHSAAITAGLSVPVPSLGQPSSADTSQLSVATSSSPPAQSPASSAPTLLNHETGVLTSKAFTSFLLSPDNSVFKDEKQDMTRPLPEYYISSSHNTYLVGHQLVGESTIEGYIRALLHSCRSVEIDIYDGEIEPVIYHGKTLTTKVPLRDICQAIARYAFVTSPYPIIISAEVHCGLVQQAMIATIMSDVFGEALVKAPVDGRPKIECLPSPEDLKGRVMLKAKNLYMSPHEAMQENEISVDAESSSTETSASDSDLREEIKHEWRKARENEQEVIKGLKSEFSKAKSELSKAKKVLERVNPRRGSSSNQARPSIAPSANSGSSRTEKTKVKMSFELVALLVYTVGVKCRGLNKKEVYAPEHMFSLSENTANKILKQGMMDLIKHNKTHLVRTYPKGTRIGSTNYEPHRYWSAGCQLVALNWQTFDLGYMINHAMFQRNDRMGYVLKPLPLRNADKHLFSQRTKHLLDITIISAQQLPRAKDALGREIIDKGTLDPFVEVSIHIPDWTHSPFLPPTSNNRAYSPPSTATAVAATSARTVTVKTGVVKNNGFNPVWEQPLSLPFDCVGDMLDLVFVRFAVKQEDKDDADPLAVYCTSLASFNLGYHHLPLHDTQLSQYLFSTLFIHANIRNIY